MNSKSTATDTAHRRTWDKEEFEKKARERAKKLKEVGPDGKPKGDNAKKQEKAAPLAPLQSRSGKVNLTGMLGKTQLVYTSSGSSQQPGFYCKVCDCTIKDSIGYLDHINGKKHHQNMNMSLKIKRDTLDDVKEKLAKLKSKIEDSSTKGEYDFEERVSELKRKRVDHNLKKREKQKEKKLKEREELEEYQNPEFASLMGPILSSYDLEKKTLEFFIAIHHHPSDSQAAPSFTLQHPPSQLVFRACTETI
ncbi:Zinc finger matrin-type protein 2 [Zancudomyces culisetae]|uniref:Zinc finger matrin-type protein 2 n=1 Tax=Zancudomyces culisetae TaxID=1213189 RepID=A0A1R1PRH3_ZANCU|nr:Zinc finger matrin-type protein 2 [Zancudomyces culisetae]OMH83575.1 Zinc finger matrin-type protein 2 [Zancudomyces culisetae]|eukprot:OMH78630.1 Zinc finger matrin-type protein 2 [Zancudomyces culisetae]